VEVPAIGETEAAHMLQSADPAALPV
jgi:hypothetical protein